MFMWYSIDLKTLKNITTRINGCILESRFDLTNTGAGIRNRVILDTSNYCTALRPVFGLWLTSCFALGGYYSDDLFPGLLGRNAIISRPPGRVLRTNYPVLRGLQPVSRIAGFCRTFAPRQPVGAIGSA